MSMWTRPRTPIRCRCGGKCIDRVNVSVLYFPPVSKVGKRIGAIFLSFKLHHPFDVALETWMQEMFKGCCLTA